MAAKKLRYGELYDIRGGRAYCKQRNCTANYKWCHESGTSHPLQHYKDKHPSVLASHFEKPTDQPTFQDFLTRTTPGMTIKTKSAMAICFAQHPIPFSFFDDPVNKWAFGLSTSSETVRNGVIELYEKVYSWEKRMSCYRRLDKFNHRRQTCLRAPSAPQPGFFL